VYDHSGSDGKQGHEIVLALAWSVLSAFVWAVLKRVAARLTLSARRAQEEHEKSAEGKYRIRAAFMRWAEGASKSLTELLERALTASTLMLWTFVVSTNLEAGLLPDQFGSSLHRKLVGLWAIAATFLGAAVKLCLEKVRCAIDPSQSADAKSREEEEHGFLSNGVSFFTGFGWVLVLRDLQETDEMGWLTGERLHDGLFGVSPFIVGVKATDLTFDNLVSGEVVLLNKAWWGGLAG
jgi:hypothetical protein